ncbi:BQ2448_7526 [Microbotryum intermedium]|uniref:BQ2448_7526 protein n=1 Tax=Microbotryum intermedium TaxID=269621 RepID=A0A238FII6_9BASI|nr:BQ2448_7526 [Microbotryum intermedium]
MPPTKRKAPPPASSSASSPTSPTPTLAQLLAALSYYPTSLTLRANASNSSKDLVELDHWFRVELRQKLGIFDSANDDVGATKMKTKRSASKLGLLDSDDLTKLMRWKLARGKFRPRLVELASSNPTPLIHSVLTPLQTPSTPSLPLLSSLSTLRGIGPATSSALLSLYRPQTDPFLSDEAWTVFFPSVKPEYTEKAYKRFCEVFRERLETEAWENAEELEMACWSWAVTRKYGKREEDGKNSKGKESDSILAEARKSKEEEEGGASKSARRKMK